MMLENQQLVKQTEHQHDIAVVGMACQFPGGCNTPDQYWQLISQGQCAIDAIPDSRWNQAHFADKLYAKKAGLLDDVAQFDYEFFNITKREADLMDPQQRLLLETTWHALENAHVSLDTLHDSDTGIFMGQSWHDYAKIAYGVNANGMSAYSGLGNMQSMTAGRLAYFLGTQGPAMVLDTSCSSSLVAVHQGVKSLQFGETSLAITGGVSLMLSPLSSLLCCELNALSPTDQSHVFANDASGYVRGEGVGVVILKRLSDAIAENDSILAVIKGSAVNHDGKSSGLTVPNRHAQQRVIQSALHSATMTMAELDYLEAHGTGTALGDPIELGAISELKEHDQKPLLLGSVKANIGHLEAAAGIAGLIKSVLMIQQKTIPAQINSQPLNQHFDWRSSQLSVPQKQQPCTKQQMTIGVSSFGISGTNAHVILQTPKSRLQSITKTTPNIFVLSAKTQMALNQLVEHYHHWLQGNPSINFTDVCYSSQTGRTHFRQRLAIFADDIESLAQGLTNHLAGRSSNESTEQQLVTLKTQYLAYEQPDWLALYDDEIPTKISLLAYPFERKHCWVAHDYSTEGQAAETDVSLNQDLQTIHTTIKTTLLNELCQLTSLSETEISLQDSFWDLGFDSMMWIELKTALNESLPVAVDDVDIFNHPTIEALTDHLMQKWHEASNNNTENSAVLALQQELNDVS